MKTMRIAKFFGLDPRSYEGIKRIVASEIGLKRLGTFDKQAPIRLIKFPKMSSNNNIGQITFITSEFSLKASISARAVETHVNISC